MPRSFRRVKKTSSISLPRVGFPLLAIFAFFVVFCVYFSYKNDKWDGVSRFTVVVSTENPTIYSYNPDSNSLLVLSIPKNTQVSSWGGYGDLFVGSLWNLGKQEKKGGVILQKSIQKSLGVPVDAYIDKSGEEVFSEGAWGFVRALTLSFRTGALGTNLTFFDRVRLVMSVAGVGKTTRVSLDAEKMGIVKKTTLSDGVDAFLVSTSLNNGALSSFRDDLIFKEGKTVRVVNASGKSGLAGSVTRLVGVLGLRVLSVETAQVVNSDRCVVRGVEGSSGTRAVAKMVKLYGCKYQNSEVSGADLEIVIGNKFED